MGEERHQVLERDGFPVGNFLRLRPDDEAVEQRRVGFLGMLGLPAFVPQELQKIFHERLHGRFLTVEGSSGKWQMAREVAQLRSSLSELVDKPNLAVDDFDFQRFQAEALARAEI